MPTGMVASSVPRPIARSRNTLAQSTVTPWKKRCMPRWWMGGQRRPITSAASRAAIGLRPRAVLANSRHRPKFASGKCSRKIHRLPVTMAARVWTVSTIREIVTRPGTDLVTSLRRHAVSQMAASIAHKPASRPPSHAARTYAPVGSPKDSARFQPTVRSSDAGRGSSRQSAGAGWPPAQAAGSWPVEGMNRDVGYQLRFVLSWSRPLGRGGGR
jgi:hypothetical protein